MAAHAPFQEYSVPRSLSSEARVQQAQSRNEVELHNEKLVPEGDGLGKNLNCRVCGERSLAVPSFLMFKELKGGKNEVALTFSELQAFWRKLKVDSVVIQ